MRNCIVKMGQRILILPNGEKRKLDFSQVKFIKDDNGGVLAKMRRSWVRWKNYFGVWTVE